MANQNPKIFTQNIKNVVFFIITFLNEKQVAFFLIPEPQTEL